MTLLLVLDAPVKLEPAHVEALPDTLVVTVTQAHIERAWAKTKENTIRGHNCPIALAAADVTGGECSMGYGNLRTPTRSYFSDDAGKWARDFDVDPSSVSPATFIFTRATRAA